MLLFLRPFFHMTKGRMEAFSDGVIAIIITIMVLEFHPPSQYDLASLFKLTPVFVSYVGSFVFLGIYWNNHHHMLHSVKKINGAALWANLNLLFWLSLVPFVTAWMGQSHFAITPVAVYGFILLMAAIAYTILSRVLIKLEGSGSIIARAINSDKKGKLSILLYVLGIALSNVQPWIGFLCYAIVSVIWLVPDSRFERLLVENSGSN